MRYFVITALMASLLTPTSIPVSADECPIYPEEAKALVYQIMNSRSIIREVHIRQEDCRLGLAIIISYTANEIIAKEHGDDMVRLTKSFGPEPGPRGEIGKGLYDYLVGVFSLDEKRLALGAKSRNAKSITW